MFMVECDNNGSLVILMAILMLCFTVIQRGFSLGSINLIWVPD